MKTANYIIKKIILFTLILLLCLLARIISSMVPAKPIRANMQKYLPKMEFKGESQFNVIKMPLDTGENSGLDFYSENAYLHTVYLTDPSHPIKASIENTIADVPEELSGGRALYLLLSGEKFPTTGLPTYWYGVVTVLRPLIAIMEYDFAITFLQFICLILCFYAFALIRQKLGNTVGLAFLFGILGVNIITTTMLAFTISTIMVMLSSIIWVMKNEDADDGKIIDFFMVVGVLTAYFDWFTTPILSFAYPMMLLIIMFYQNNRLSGYKDGFLFMLKNGLSWAISYLCMVVSKWIIATVFLNESIIARGLLRFKENSERSENTEFSGTLQYIFVTIKESVYDTFYIGIVSPEKRSLVVFVIFLVSLVIVIISIIKQKNDYPVLLYVLLCSLVPIAWIIVFHGHVHAHHYYDYRILAATLSGYFIIMAKCIDSIKTIKKE